MRWLLQTQVWKANFVWPSWPSWPAWNIFRLAYNLWSALHLPGHQTKDQLKGVNHFSNYFFVQTRFTLYWWQWSSSVFNAIILMTMIIIIGGRCDHPVIGGDSDFVHRHVGFTGCRLSKPLKSPENVSWQLHCFITLNIELIDIV